MRIGFYTVLPENGDRTHYRFAANLIRSIRRTMPGTMVTQFTDPHSPHVPGVDEVHRVGLMPLSWHRSWHYAQVDGEWLFLDTDVVMQQDVRQIFEGVFDIAVSDRHWPHLEATPRLATHSPYNAGVVFSRSKAFWEDVHAEVVDKQLDAFMGDQMALNRIAASGRYHVHVLPGVRFNYPPAVSPQDNKAMCDRLRPQASVLHYKGKRRKRLLEQAIGARHAQSEVA